MQEDDDGNMRIISFASHTLKLYEKSMHNYSSTKLELLAIKWSVCKKFRNYLIGSKFTVLTDNNRLTYVQTSHLGTSQIRWFPMSRYSTLILSTGWERLIRQLMLSVSDL